MSRARLCIRIFALAACAVFCGSNAAWAASHVTCASPASSRPEPVEYFVSLADAADHIAHVSIRLPHGEGKRVLNMPVWNALYQVRNFATNVQQVRAEDASGAPLPVVNVRPSEWEFDAPAGCAVLSYDIYLDSPGPFGSSLSAAQGFFNWAMVLMYSPATRTQPLSLRFKEVPSSWGLRDVHVLGAAQPGKVESVVGVAQNYDELVDSPAELGSFRESQFEQDGATYHVVVAGDPGGYDLSNLNNALGKITHAAVEWMQDRPYDQYTFLYQFAGAQAAGGMEHAYGTAIDINADRLRESIVPVVGISAHEFFHLWNAKRIRPQSLEPVDYQRDNDTRALWFCEGVTSTVADILLVRAGFFGELEYVRRLSEAITDLQGRPAHRWQSAEESSLDAWFENNAFYRSPQRSISYYNKGEILGVLLDLRIRQLTGNKKSLRDLFHWMNDHYYKQHVFYADSKGVEDAAEAITGQSFASFFHDYVAGAEEIPYDDFFQFVGLHLADKTVALASSGFTSTSNLGEGPEVVQVQSDGPAAQAGIAVGDRITFLNGKPADSSLDDELTHLPANSVAELRIERHGVKRVVKLRLTSHPEHLYYLLDLPSVTPGQRAHRNAWIHGENEDGAAP